MKKLIVAGAGFAALNCGARLRPTWSPHHRLQSIIMIGPDYTPAPRLGSARRLVQSI